MILEDTFKRKPIKQLFTLRNNEYISFEIFTSYPAAPIGSIHCETRNPIKYRIWVKTTNLHSSLTPRFPDSAVKNECLTWGYMREKCCFSALLSNNVRHKQVWHWVLPFAQTWRGHSTRRGFLTGAQKAPSLRRGRNHICNHSHTILPFPEKTSLHLDSLMLNEPMCKWIEYNRTVYSANPAHTVPFNLIHFNIVLFSINTSTSTLEKIQPQKSGGKFIGCSKLEILLISRLITLKK